MTNNNYNLNLSVSLKPYQSKEAIKEELQAILDSAAESGDLNAAVDEANESRDEDNQLSVSEIADRLHYSSVAHLSSQFKSVTGISPSAFRGLKGQSLTPIDSI